MSFALSKLLWACVSPGSLLAFLLAGGLALSATARPFWVKAGKGVCSGVCLCLLAIAIFPVGEWALTPLENRFADAALPDQVDGIIVIGGDEQTEISEKRGVPTALDSMRRYVVFTELARRYPDARLVFSGGSGFLHPQAKMLDATVARGLLTEIGAQTPKAETLT